MSQFLVSRLSRFAEKLSRIESKITITDFRAWKHLAKSSSLPKRQIQKAETLRGTPTVSPLCPRERNGKFRNLEISLSHARATISVLLPRTRSESLPVATLVQAWGSSSATLVLPFGRTMSGRRKRAKWSDDVPELVRTTKLARIIMDFASRIHEGERSCG